MRREAQLAALRYDEERQKNRSLQRDSVHCYSKVPPVQPVTHQYTLDIYWVHTHRHHIVMVSGCQSNRTLPARYFTIKAFQ